MVFIDAKGMRAGETGEQGKGVSEGVQAEEV